MKLYCGIDLHSTNAVISILNERDQVVYERRHPNDLGDILTALLPLQDELDGVVVESTFNWYWLVDGLIAQGLDVRLANTARMKQYDGLKYTDDAHDARWLARQLRLGILPEGYIYPKEERALRDLLRKRGQLVRLQTMQLLSIGNLWSRNTGAMINGKAIKELTPEALASELPLPEQALAAGSNLAVLRTLEEQIGELEQAIKARVKPREEMRWVRTISGVGQILGWTILLETGDISRFKKVGNFASYCRCVESKRLSNGKKKGENNRKCGNKYLGWAFIEAANFAIRCEPRIDRFYQRKKAKTKRVVALKAVAHKLARATYHVLRERTAFDVTRAFP